MSTCWQANEHVLSSIQSKGLIMAYVCKRCSTPFNATVRTFRPNPTYCSRKCAGGTLKFWDTSSYDDKIARLKSSFLKLIDKTEECWIWKGAIVRRYGLIRFDHSNIRAHRASWLIHHGEIPKGMLVLHKCDTPLCVNPEHLFLGTPLDNTRDMIKKGRSRFGINKYNKG